MVEVFVVSTEDPALNEEESTLDGADALAGEVKDDIPDVKLNIPAGVPDDNAGVDENTVNDGGAPEFAAMVADAPRSVATTSVPGIRYHWCHLQAY